MARSTPAGRIAPIEVLNKADLLGRRRSMLQSRPGAVAVSALTGEGLDCAEGGDRRTDRRAAWKPPIMTSRRRMARGWRGCISMARWLIGRTAKAPFT